ncbi:MAG: hypothetical protein IMZ52_02325 [Actinobacteria bacterium]|nr:hypothetical protein [Actinomycetota bacterium]MBE3114859.1 hypothetical protein [Actinomycetota bacterium]
MKKRKYPRKGEYVKRTFIDEVGYNTGRYIIFLILGNSYRKITIYKDLDNQPDIVYDRYVNKAKIVCSPIQYSNNERLLGFITTHTFNLTGMYDKLIDENEVIARMI